VKLRGIYFVALAVVLGLAAQIAPARADSYGAIAYSAQTGYWAWSVGTSSAEDANTIALSSCKKKGAGCEVVISFSNSCAALAAGTNKVFAAGQADNRQGAEGDALKGCRSKGGIRCNINVAYCVNPSPNTKLQRGPQASLTPSPFQRAMERDYKNLFEATIIFGAQAPNGSAMPTDQLLALASRDGLQRFDDAEILELIRLRSELVRRADTTTCAGIWSGAAVGKLVPAIEKLPADQQRQWAALFNRAAQATIDKVPVRPAPTRDQFQSALNRMVGRLPPLDLEAIDAAINDPARLTPEQECSAVRVFYGAITRANRADAVTVARAHLYE